MFLKELRYTFVALQVGCLHIALNSVGRRDLEVGVPSCEHVNKFAVRDDACRAIAFGYPLCDVSSDDVLVPAKSVETQSRGSWRQSVSTLYVGTNT